MKCAVLILAVTMVGLTWARDMPCPNRINHSVVFGGDNPDARLVMTEKVKAGMEPGRIVSGSAQYPRKGDLSKGWITKIEIQDLATNSRGGCAMITDGGVGNTKVAVKIQSQKALGMDFVVKVWAITDITNAV